MPGKIANATITGKISITKRLLKELRYYFVSVGRELAQPTGSIDTARHAIERSVGTASVLRYVGADEGPTMNEDLTPGWYSDDAHGRRYWSGTSWLVPDTAEETSVDTKGPPSLGLTPQLESMPPATRAPRFALRQRPVVLGAAAAGLLVIGGLTWGIVGYAAGASEREAPAACQSAMIERLRSPATAVVSNVRTYDRAEHARYLLDSLYELVGLDPDETDEEGQAVLIESSQEKIQSDAAKGITTWFVVGDVDSENGFSAMVRNEWTCEATWTDGEFSSIEVTFSEE